MKKLPSLLKTFAHKGSDLRSSTSSHINRMYTGFQALEANGQSQKYHATKLVGLGGVFLLSALSLQPEGMIAAGIGIGDEVTFLENLPKDAPKPPGRDIS